MIQVMLVITVLQVVQIAHCLKVKLTHLWVDFSSHHNRYMIVHLFTCSCDCCLPWAISKFIAYLVSLTCDIQEHAPSLHSLLVLSEIVPILGTSIMFHIQYTNLLLHSLDRYTATAFPTCEIGHAGTSSLLSSEVSCICHTERQGYEKHFN